VPTQKVSSNSDFLVIKENMLETKAIKCLNGTLKHHLSLIRRNLYFLLFLLLIRELNILNVVERKIIYENIKRDYLKCLYIICI